MIEVRGLAKRFRSVRAVDDVSFRAEDAQITALLGPNGAGKSTTLRILSTVLKPDSGVALIGGHDVRGEALAARRSLGVLPHGSGIYPHLTARENIRFYGRLQGIAADVLEQRLEDVVDTLDLRDIADRRAKGFSQGERTRVALARALVNQPQHLLLDEPTSGLDVMARRRLREHIRGLRHDGRCVIVSSHIMQEVASLCDRIIVLAHGRVAAAGSIDELLEKTGETDLEEAFVRLAVVDSERGR